MHAMSYIALRGNEVGMYVHVKGVCTFFLLNIVQMKDAQGRSRMLHFILQRSYLETVEHNFYLENEELSECAGYCI